MANSNKEIADLTKSAAEELQAVQDYLLRARDASPDTQEVYLHIAQEEEEHFSEIMARLSGLGA
jgi:rubrerythrin